MTRPRSAVSRILSQGRLAYVAIDVGRGPLVTPVLYGALGGDLWFVTNRNALKARVLARRPSVGWVVNAGDMSVVMTGDAQLFSLSDPRATLARAALLSHAPAALASWAKRNPRQVAGFLGDSIARPRRALPQDVVLVRLKPTTSLVVPRPAHVTDPEVSALVTAALPTSLEHLPASPYGVLGLITPQGPVAVPAAWDGSAASLPAAVADLVDDAGAAACITFDDPVRTRPTQQRGVVLRGDGFLSRDAGELRWSLTPSRVTYWDGFDTQTAALAPDIVLTH
jgi:hypothetical protein